MSLDFIRLLENERGLEIIVFEDLNYMVFPKYLNLKIKLLLFSQKKRDNILTHSSTRINPDDTQKLSWT